MWGLYDASGNLIDAAAYYRGPGKSLVGQSKTVDLSQIQADDAPEDLYVYGGVLVEHFGHFITSSLSRYWPFLNAGFHRQFSSRKILCHGVGGPDSWFTLPYMATPFEALDLARSGFIGFTRPTRIAKIVVARPSFEEHNFVSTVYIRLMRLIGKRLLGSDMPQPVGPLFISRGQYPVLSQGFENEGELEAILSSMGVKIVHPEKLSIADQIRVFEEQSVVAGMVGSAFHTAVFCRNPPPLICLSPTHIVNSNYDMLDRVTSQNACYFHVENQYLGFSETGRIRHVFRMANPEKVACELLASMQAACA